jgi:hypothetical protein
LGLPRQLCRHLHEAFVAASMSWESFSANIRRSTSVFRDPTLPPAY